ncbi:glutamate/tyrosine decarboxylase-like PLP-dependent enzyme [Nocardia tenerifensis]|uniref:Glutamate/tyrosine decarboxylase-like PLP-dependent enzyme n=1 Tax=Nocardia tenerifensis TaxID=228006 RepID=A0A318JWC4_9NOCA|nr:pyridoxal-dependent decarboxylase [Nocardia tenerifensis]PXX61590.1 glutamate/tyrosine decarboxylase-like PLP-dependent enzyme [Nocardia tenerifensis]
MDENLANDLAEFPALLEAVRESATDMLTGIESRPVARAPEALGREELPEHGVGLARALARFREDWEPRFSGSAGPRYFGFVTGGATPASVAGDWLTGVLDQNAMSGEDSAAIELERQTVDWIARMFGLDRHTGAFVSGATMSNFVGLAIAREWLGERIGISVADSGVGALGPVPVLSGTPHSSIFKSLSMLGIGRDSVRSVPTLPGREAVDVDRLAEALAALDGRPAIVVANAGTVNTVDFDDIRAIAALRERFPFWLHVDGAFGAFAALSPEHAELVDGLGEADSVCIDLHKWLNVPYDAGVQFSRHRDLQLRVFLNSAAYLSAPTGTPDFGHLVPENSRRLRALTAWFSLTAYGRAGHRDIVRRNISGANSLAGQITASGLLRLVAPVRLNVACFTLADRPTAERVTALADAIAESGETFVTPTVYEGQHALRAAFSNWRTTDADVERAAKAITAAALTLD